MTRTWIIEDEQGKRRVTVEQYRAELAERAAMAKPIMEAVRAGDLKACARAQAAMRVRFNGGTR